MELDYKCAFIQGTPESAEFYAPMFKSRTRVYVYKIKGWKLELDLYKKDKGDRYVEDIHGNALWFTNENRVFLTGAPLIRTNEGEYVADTKVKAC